MIFTAIIGYIGILVYAALAAVAIFVVVLIIKALRKYINATDVREEKSQVRKSLGEVLKQHRMRCQMTQEFVAEAIGVSRQTVSKWENGVTDPTTSNLMALAKLYGITAEELIQAVSE